MVSRIPKAALLLFQMALVTITGYPCSGKSNRAQQLKSQLESRLAAEGYEGPNLKVSIVSDHDLNIARTSYNGTKTTGVSSNLTSTLTQIVNQRNQRVDPCSQLCKGKWARIQS